MRHCAMETDHQPREIKENRALLRNLVKLSKELHITMSQISDWAVAEQADLTAIAGSLAAIVSGVTILDTLIANFQNSPGALSAADQASLDGIQGAVRGLVTQAAAINVTPPQVAASAAAAAAAVPGAPSVPYAPPAA